MSGFVPRINIDNDDDDVLINNLTGWMRRNGAYISEDVEVRGVNQTKEENGKDEDGHKEPKGGQERESGSIQGDGLHHNYEQNGQLEQGVLVSKSWGIFAKEKIPKHTIICAIPYPLMIQQTHPPERIKGFAGPQEDLGYEQFISQQEKRTQNKHTLKNKNDQNDQNDHNFKIPQNIFDNIAEFSHGSMVLLYLHLLNQKDSFFRDYLSTLPSHYNHIPSNNLIQFSKPLSNLGFDSRVNIQAGNAGIIDDYEKVHKFIQKNIPKTLLPNSRPRNLPFLHNFDPNSNHNDTTIPEFDLQTFLFLKNIIDSRSFAGQRILDRDLTPEILLIPFIDLLNHSGVENVTQVSRKKTVKTLFPEPRQGFFTDNDDNLHYLITLCDIEKGDELTYGYQASFERDQMNDLELLDRNNSKQILNTIRPINFNNPKMDKNRFENTNQSDQSEGLIIKDGNINGVGTGNNINGRKFNEQGVNLSHPINKLNSNWDQNGKNGSIFSKLSTQSTIPKLSSYLMDFIEQLPELNPLSSSSITTTLKDSISRTPFVQTDDILGNESVTPYPHLHMFEKFGIMSLGSHREFYIDHNCEKKSDYYFHIKPSFFLNLSNLDHILHTSSQYYYQSLRRTGLHQIVHDPEYLNLLKFVEKQHKDFISGNDDQNDDFIPTSQIGLLSKQKTQKRRQTEKFTLSHREKTQKLNQIAFPFNSLPLPFKTTLFQPLNNIKSLQLNNNDTGLNDVSNDEKLPQAYSISKISLTPPLQQLHYAISKLMVERLDLLEGHGSPEPAKKPLFNIQYEIDNDVLETVNQTASNVQFLSQLLPPNTLQSQTSPPTQDSLLHFDTQSIFKKPRMNIKPVDEYEVLNVAYPFRFGLTNISPQLEAYCYFLAAHSVNFEKLNLIAYNELEDLVKDAFEGANVEQRWADFYQEMDGGGELEYETTGGKKKNNKNGSTFLSKFFPNSSPKTVLDDNQSVKLDNVIKLGRRSHFGDVYHPTTCKTTPLTDNDIKLASSIHTPDHINKIPHNSDIKDQFSLLHLPAYSILLGIIDTLFQTQANLIVEPSTPTFSNDNPPSLESLTSSPRRLFTPLEINKKMDNMSVDFYKTVSNAPNYALQHIFNSIATKINVDNQFWDIERIGAVGKRHGGFGPSANNDDNNNLESQTDGNNNQTTPYRRQIRPPLNVYQADYLNSAFLTKNLNPSEINELEKKYSFPVQYQSSDLAFSTNIDTNDSNVPPPLPDYLRRDNTEKVLMQFTGIESPVGWISGDVVADFGNKSSL
jgi:hypothetical protein